MGLSLPNTAPVIVDIQPGSRCGYSGGDHKKKQWLNLALQDIAGEQFTPNGEKRSCYLIR